MQSDRPAANSKTNDASKEGKLSDISIHSNGQDMADDDAERGNTKRRKAVLYDSDDE